MSKPFIHLWLGDFRNLGSLELYHVITHIDEWWQVHHLQRETKK